MRVINDTEFKHELSVTVNVTHNASPKYLEWVTGAALKWLLKNKPDFVKQFCTQIYEKKHSMFSFDNEPEALKTWAYKGIDGKPQRVFLKNEFDIKDAAAGSLYYFLPFVSFHHWLWNQNPIFIEARDFFDDLLERKPNEDLRKYTLETLPRQITAWRVEYEARIIRERIAAAEEAARLAAEMTREEQGAYETDEAITKAMQSATKELREQALKLAWGNMIEGQDYTITGSYGGVWVYNLLSPRALDYEATFKGSCIGGSGYKRRLKDGKSLFLSTRLADDRYYAVHTSEVVLYDNAFDVIQFERWGYKFADVTNDYAADKVQKKALEDFLKPLTDSTESMAMLFPLKETRQKMVPKIIEHQSGDLSYTITRRI